jgi:2-polyprenyl-3-methyl-5-hydroxy-6-metoxy-1,4-benzoquinol methylase
MKRKMNFLYNFANLPRDAGLLAEINSAALRLYEKLRIIKADTLNISDYNKRALRKRLYKLISSLQLYSYLLSLVLADNEVPRKRFVLVDYGGGVGILSLLAKELGIGTVIYIDINGLSCKDAKTTGKILGIDADFYVQGNIEELIDFIKKKKISCNAVASHDVIEHIYDIENFFKKITLLSNNGLTIAMSSGANMFNPRRRNLEIKRQIEAECFGWQKKLANKERVFLKSYLKVRRDIIVGYLTKYKRNLSEKEINILANKTRGKRKEDIFKCVEDYIEKGIYPVEPEHPTNTCDPYTGSWMEHLFNPYVLKKILVKRGFKARVLNGYYGYYKNPIKKLAVNFMNISISILKKQGIRLASFYVIYARK